MRSSRRKRRHLSIASLIDVIFLLLLFFMLASTFTQFSELNIGASANAQSSASSDSPPMLLELDRARLTLDGQDLTVEGLHSAIEERIADQPQMSLQVGGGVKAQRLADVLVALEPIDGLQVNMVSQP